MSKIYILALLSILTLTAEAGMEIKLTSPAFKDSESIPSKYTCDGAEINPPLEWTNIPKGAKSIALISDDPDAPMGDWVHWVIFNIPVTEIGLKENIPHDPTLPNGAIQGVNSSRQIGYDAPCPPSGTHRYFFKIYALDTELTLKPGATKRGLLKAIEGHILSQGQLMGRYSRKR